MLSEWALVLQEDLPTRSGLSEQLGYGGFSDEFGEQDVGMEGLDSYSNIHLRDAPGSAMGFTPVRDSCS